MGLPSASFTFSFADSNVCTRSDTFSTCHGGFRVQGSGCRGQGSGFRVQGPGFRVQGSGFRVQGTCHERIVTAGGRLLLWWLWTGSETDVRSYCDVLSEQIAGQIFAAHRAVPACRCPAQKLSLRVATRSDTFPTCHGARGASPISRLGTPTGVPRS